MVIKPHVIFTQFCYETHCTATMCWWWKLWSCRHA